MQRGTRWRRSAVVAAALVAATLATAVVLLPVAGGDAPTTRGTRATASDTASTRLRGAGTALTSSTPLPADCIPNPAGPPGAPYQLGLVGTVHGGVLTAGPTTVADISATFCGIVTLADSTGPSLCPVTGDLASPPDGQVYGPLSVALTLVPDTNVSIGFVPQPGTITGTFACSGSSENGLVVTLDAAVSGTTAPLFGVSCTIGPFTIPLTGTVTGPLTDLTATLVGSDFTVPAISSSPTCPGALPDDVDAVAGLPIAPGGASASLPVTASLYQPANQP